MLELECSYRFEKSGLPLGNFAWQKRQIKSLHKSSRARKFLPSRKRCSRTHDGHGHWQGQSTSLCDWRQRQGWTRPWRHRHQEDLLRPTWTSRQENKIMFNWQKRFHCGSVRISDKSNRINWRPIANRIIPSGSQRPAGWRQYQRITTSTATASFAYIQRPPKSWSRTPKALCRLKASWSFPTA